MQDIALTPEICTKILQNRFKEPNIQFIKYEIAPISQDAEGYMGVHLNLNITYKLNDETLTEKLFMKRKPTKNSVQVEAAEETGVYKHEIFVYDFLLKEFEKYGFETSFAAKSYYCIPDTALILENLQTKGYSILERNTAFSMEHIKCLLKNLALLHAGGYAYEKIKSKELKRDFKLGKEYPNEMQELFYMQFIDQDAYCMKFWKGCMTTLSVLIDLLHKDESFKQKFQTMFQKYEFGKIFVEDVNLKKTCGHGDLWSNNMMFKTINGSLESKLLDFQIFRYFYPSFDIILAVYCNTSKEFREKHLNELYEYYYKILSETFQKYGHNVEDFYTLEELYKSLDLVKPDALIQVTFTNTLIGMSKENLNECVASDDGMNELMFGNEKLAAAAFQSSEMYRNLITDSLLELYDAMLVRQ